MGISHLFLTSRGKSFCILVPRILISYRVYSSNPHHRNMSTKSEGYYTLLLKDFLFRPKVQLAPEIRADNKTIIVTGGNTGIGKTTTMDLAKRGGKIYMACRDMIKCNETRDEIIQESHNDQVYCGKCDLSDFDSIRRFAEEFKSKEDKLDILINNAGVMRTPQSKTKQGFELQLGTNHVGHFLLVGLLLDSLKRAAPSRIVVVSSLAHSRAKIDFDDLNMEKSYDAGKAYEQSKLCNILFTRELARKLEGTGVTVNALNPGVVNTEIMRHMEFQNGGGFSKYIVQPMLRLFLKSPEQGAQTSLYVALEPTLENISGKYFSDSKEIPPSEEAQNPEYAQRLWEQTEKWTNFKYNV